MVPQSAGGRRKRVMQPGQDADDFMLPDDALEPPSSSNVGLRAFPDISLERGMPASPDAERSILGAILLENTHFHEASNGITADDFSLESHRRIFSRMEGLILEGRPVDLVSLVEELARKKEVESVGGVAYIASLTEGLPRRVSIDEYVRIVADKSIARQLIHKCNTIMTKAVDQAEHGTDLVREMTEGMLDISARAKSVWRVRPAKPILEGARTFIGGASKHTEWTINGIIQRGGNGIIAGVPGASKSLAVLDLATHLITGSPWMGRDILHRCKVAVVSREDYPGLTKQRALSMIAGAPPEQSDRFEELDLDEWLYFNTRAQSSTFSLQKETDVLEIIEAIKERGIEVAFFDVFRRLWDGDENDNQEVAKVLAVLTRIQTEANCAVALVHHLKKEQGHIFDRIRGASAIYGWREWAIGISIENPEEEDHTKRVRKLWFDTKADAAALPIHYQIDSAMGRMDLVECAPLETYSKPRRGEKAPLQAGMVF